METNFNFKSQICTSKEQSERLLSLGLKKETADMTWEFSHTKNGEPQYDCRAESSWDSETFARYVEHCEKIGYFDHWKHEDGSKMTPEEVYNEIMKKHIPAWSLHRLLSLIEYDDGFIDVSLREGRYGIHYGYDDEWYGNLYDAVISCIQALIEEKDFNKEYLI